MALNKSSTETKMENFALEITSLKQDIERREI
jgi:hypothetical protein